jgi:CRP-like cAMP-binding protein
VPGRFSRHLISRLASWLLEKVDEGTVQKMTGKELAAKLCGCRESVTTALGEHKRAGILEIERQQDDVIDRAPLERAARD